MSAIEPLLRPFALRGLDLPNRVVMAPMTRYRSPAGVPTGEVASYYARRAATGLGLILTEGVALPHYAAADHPDIPRIDGVEVLQGWRKVIDAVHAAGGRIVPQLWHQGPMWNVEYAGTGTGNPMRPSGIWGPADGVISFRPEGREASLAPVPPMTDSDIADVIAAYALAARNAVALGTDGIAIHGAHGYLIDTFLWDYTNRRDDRWGGDPMRRAAFGAEVVRAIRAEIGEARPIVLRFSQFKMQNYQALLADTPDALGALLGPLADAGVDLFDASQRYFDTPTFEGSSLNLAGWAKKLTGKASMTVGGVALDKARGNAKHIDDSQQSVNNLPLLVERFERGEFDLVAVGRAILNDPAWFTKAVAGEPFLPFDPASLERLT
ncbi:12-oxophytodienoate reductase [Sphingomonas histidinilytica]|uniref:2,4-dienoyl-CoA reductase n=1 Tax=Rhizorhabdus histidinilytica TaxID=439228 RepID=A0A1T5A3T1_9SPHN|nr:NADH:flavin oxidoreductase [Rhizorhabdus histidinilytica]MBO9376160.1 12-oxophytodienoate reductase [Rhizorhabdus histidinilytica]SKB29671.1 2,4-dienoyl-CoA reductase [Rhizorhabdus histidinilytica]